MPENPETPLDTLDEYSLNDATNRMGRLLPHNVDAEMAVLACLMNDPNAWDYISGSIEASEFYDPNNRKIFQSIETLANQGKSTDPISVSEALLSTSELQRIGGFRYLSDVKETIHDPKLVRTYARMVHDTSLRRELIGASDFIRTVAQTPGKRTIEQLLSEAESRVLGVSERPTNERYQHTLDEILLPTVDHIDKLRKSDGGIAGLSSGFYDLDNLTGGFKKSDLILVAGRPSMGKTSFALNICEHVILPDNPLPVLFFSVEQDHSQLIMRLLAAQSGIPYMQLENGKLNAQQWRQLQSSAEFLMNRHFFIVDRPSISVDEMRSYLKRINRELKAEGRQSAGGSSDGVALVVVDYVGLMKSNRRQDNRNLELGEISRSLKALAKEFTVPVIALSQLNRAVESREDKRPRMSDLRDSGELEQDADLILFIYRDEIYNKETKDLGKAELILAKHRNGPRGAVKINFVEKLMKFEGPEEGREEMQAQYSSGSSEAWGPPPSSSGTFSESGTDSARTVSESSEQQPDATGEPSDSDSDSPSESDEPDPF